MSCNTDRQISLFHGTHTLQELIELVQHTQYDPVDNECHTDQQNDHASDEPCSGAVHLLYFRGDILDSQNRSSQFVLTIRRDDQLTAAHFIICRKTVSSVRVTVFLLYALPYFLLECFGFFRIITSVIDRSILRHKTSPLSCRVLIKSREQILHGYHCLYRTDHPESVIRHRCHIPRQIAGLRGHQR